MGFSVCWIAVRGKPPESVLSALGFEKTGEHSEIVEPGYSAAMLPNGWFVVIDDHQDFHFYSENTFRHIAVCCEIVACAIEEHSMYSAACSWNDRRQIWSIDHDSSKGVENLKISGDLPSEFASIRDRLLSEQRSDNTTYQGIGVDHVFEVPIELASQLTGFRHDTDLVDVGEKPFAVLRRIISPKKSFFQRLFGGRRD